MLQPRLCLFCTPWSERELLIPPHLCRDHGVWFVKKVIRGKRFRQSTGVPVIGGKNLPRAIARQKEIEAAWEKGQPFTGRWSRNKRAGR